MRTRLNIPRPSSDDSLATFLEHPYSHALDDDADTVWRTDALPLDAVWGLGARAAGVPGREVAVRRVAIRCSCESDVWDVYIGGRGVADGPAHAHAHAHGDVQSYEGVKLCPWSRFEWGARVYGPRERNEAARSYVLEILFRYRGAGGRFDVSAHFE